MPATRRTPSTKRCSSSAAHRRRSSSLGTSAIATCNAKIEEGLNLIEAWDRVNGVIFYRKSGEFATNRRRPAGTRDALPAHPPSRALVYVNTLRGGEDWLRGGHPPAVIIYAR
jgi:hypothetical protein